MTVLKRTSIKNQVYELIKGRILNQTYGFGHKINMLELSQELGVSNSPIREALSILESEHLVVFKPNAGPSVIEINEQIFDEVETTAMVLLSGSYDQCIMQNVIPQVIRAMETCLAEQERLADNTDRESLFEFAKLSIVFDISIIKALNNATLNQLYDSFFNLLYMVVIYDHQKVGFDRRKSIEEHRLILNTIKAGDHDEVKKNIRLHFSRSLNLI